MKKKIKVFILAMLAAAALPAYAAQIPEKTEISFKVGDSILTVNGEAMSVTAPYIVGDGTTLVPLRVITEAFGAEVSWDGETKSIDLKYPEVNITLQIGSKSALVNTHAEELLAEPELYNDTTMVPLRFISETFGAKVSYDNGLITVLKEAPKQSSQIEGAIDSEYIGDSFYGWTMKNPKNLTMADRSFDGSDTTFISDSENSGLEVIIYSDDEAMDVEERFNYIKDTFSDCAISIADKEVQPDGSAILHFRAKNKEGTWDAYEHIKDKDSFAVLAFSAFEDGMDNEMFSLAESFSISQKRDFYDLSDVQGGMHKFENEEFCFSVDVPAGWIQNDETSPNLFYFCDMKNINHRIAVEIYSKNGMTAKNYAEKDMKTREATVNSELVQVEEVKEEMLGGAKAYSYSLRYNGVKNNSFSSKDLFVEYGDYIYNINVGAENEQEINKIMLSFKVEAPSSDELGKILRSSDIGTESNLSLSGIKLKAPSNWYQAISDAIIGDGRTNAYVVSTMVGNIQNDTVLNNLFKEYTDQYTDEMTVVSKMKTISKNGHKFYAQTLKFTGETDCSYKTVYMVRVKNTAYIFDYTREDIYYGGSTDTDVENMIAGCEFK